MSKKHNHLRVCIVAEGCYPYVNGGVSSWIHSMIKSFPNVEFVVLAIVADRSYRGQFVYELPENLTEVHEIYLNDVEWNAKETKKNKKKLKKEEYEELLHLMMNEKTDWSVVFSIFRKVNFSVNDLLMGEDFFHIASNVYKVRYPNMVFSDFLWTLRSIYLPLFLVMASDLPKADIYHCVATGYAGILGSMAKDKFRPMLLISEHGIYTREREEEVIKAGWVEGIYKDIWIEQFRKMSAIAYEKADIVTSLYDHARELQLELGCPEEKLMVTPNGIDEHRFEDVPQKDSNDPYINVGAFLRVAPIKDVKTMIQAFSYAKERVPNLKLWIMGSESEQEEYARECHELVDILQVEDIEFTGQIDVREYIGKMDFTILTSISEGQPLTILESYAAHRPVIATDVGNCRELIYGPKDDFGEAGILTHIMNLEEIADAIVTMATHDERRIAMGEAGYQRAMKFYRLETMRETYTEIYKKLADEKYIEWPEEPFHV